MKKILEFLCDQWAVDRKAEWSIWMVYTKVEMPHQYISSLVDEASYNGVRGRPPVLKKLNGDVFYLIWPLFFVHYLVSLLSISIDEYLPHCSLLRPQLCEQSFIDEVLPK